jgi:hypothetical protein
MVLLCGVLGVVFCPITRGDEPVARLLAHAPRDADAVVVVRSVVDLAAGIAAFGRGSGIDDLADVEPGGLLDTVDLLGNRAGLNVGGPLVVALSAGQPGPLVVCELRDARAWLEAAEAVPLEAGYYAVELAGARAYAALAGKVLMLGHDEQAVESAARRATGAGEQWPARFREWLSADQAVVLVRVRSWAPLALPVLGAVEASMQMGAAVSGSGDEAALEMVRWCFAQAREVLGQAEMGMLGVRVGRDGLRVRKALTFTAGGTVAEYLRTITRTKRDSLRGLPDDPGLLVMAFEWEAPAGAKSLGSRMLDVLLRNERIKERVGSAAFEQAYQAIMQMQDGLSGYNVLVGLAVPEQVMAVDCVYFTNQPQALLDNMRRAYATDPEFLGAFAAGGTMSVDCRTDEVEGRTAQVFELSFETADEQARRMIEALYGRKMTMYGVAREQDVVFASGPAAQARARLSRLLRGVGTPLAENRRVGAARGAISPDPQVLLLVDVPKLFEFAVRMAQTIGGPMPRLEIPRVEAPLVSSGVYLDADALRIELFVPAEPIRVVVDTLERAKRGAGDY